MPDRVADPARQDAAHVQAVPFLAHGQRNRVRRAHAAVDHRHTGIAVAARIVGKEHPGIQREAHAVRARAQPFKGVAAIAVHPGFLQHRAVRAQQLGLHTGHRRFARVHRAVHVRVLERTSGHPARQHHGHRASLRKLAHGQRHLARLALQGVRVRHVQLRADRKERVLAQHIAQAVGARAQRVKAERARLIRMCRRYDGTALHGRHHRALQARLVLAARTVAVLIDHDAARDACRNDGANTEVLPAFAHCQRERAGLRRIAVHRIDRALAAAGEDPSARQRHAQRVFAPAHKVNRIAAVFVRLGAARRFAGGGIHQLHQRAAHASLVLIHGSVIGAVLPDHAADRAHADHADIDVHAAVARGNHHGSRRGGARVLHRHAAHAPGSNRLPRKRIAVRERKGQRRVTRRHAVKAVRARRVGDGFQHAARVGAARHRERRLHIRHAGLLVGALAVVVLVVPHHAAQRRRLQRADAHIRDRAAHRERAQRNFRVSRSGARGPGFAALRRILVAVGERHTKGIVARHQPVKREFTAADGLPAGDLLAVFVHQRHRRAAQAAFGSAHRAVKVAVLPDQAADRALRQQAVADILHLHAAQQRERLRIAAAVALGFKRQRAALLCAGEDIAVLRVHAQLVGARLEVLKGKAAVPVRLRARQDVPACAVHQVYAHAAHRRLVLVRQSVAVAVLPDEAAQAAQTHHACVGGGRRLAAGHGDRARARDVRLACLHAAARHRALRAGEAAALLRREADAVSSGREALKRIAAVPVRARLRRSFAGLAEQLHEHIRTGRLALVAVRIRVVVVEDHAGDRAREHRADIALLIAAHGQRERQAASAGARALGHAAHRIIRAGRVDLPGCAPLARQLIGDHIFARAHALKHRRARRIRRIGDLLRVLAVFQADQGNRRAGEQRLVRALLAVVLRVAENRHRQPCREGRARVNRRRRLARLQRERARRAALRHRAVHAGILAIARERPVAMKLKEHAVFARAQRFKRIRAVFIRHRLGNRPGVALAHAEQRHAHAGERLRILGNHAVAVLIHAHRAMDRRALFQLKHTKGMRVARAQLNRPDDLPILRVLAQVALRDLNRHLIGARQDAAEGELAHAARHHHNRLVVRAGVKRAHLDVQAREAGHFAALHALEHRAVNLRGIDAADVHDVIRVAAVYLQHAAGAVALVLDGRDSVAALQAAAGEDHALASIKLHAVFAAGDGIKRIAAVRARARRGNHVTAQRQQGDRHARIAARLLRVHHAVRVLIKERHAGDPAVAARAHRLKQTVGLHGEGILRLRAACEHLRLSVRLRLVDEQPLKHAACRHVHAALCAGLHAERDLARRKARARFLFAGRIADIRHADRADVVAHIIQTDRRRAGEHAGLPRVGGLPAAAVQAVFHTRAVRAARRIARAGEHHAGDVAALAAHRASLKGQGRGQQRFSALQRAGFHAQQRQSLLLRGVDRLNQVQFAVLRHLHRRHLHSRHLAALHEIRRHLNVSLRRHAERIARRGLRLAQHIVAHRHSHRVLIRLLAHLKGKHGFSCAPGDQRISAARHMRARGRVHRIQREEAPVAGDRALKRRHLARAQQHLIVGVVRGKALRAAQLVQVIRRALDRCGQLRAGIPALGHLLRRHVRPQRHLAVRVRIRLHPAVLQRVHAVLSCQRHDIGAHRAVKRQARLGDGHHRVFLQRHADFRHLAARDVCRSARCERIALRHLRLAQHIRARRQTARVKRAVLHGHFDHGAVRVGQLKADLRQILVIQPAARQAHAHAALVIKAGQRRIGLLRVLHVEAHGLRRAAAQRERLPIDHGGIPARRKAHVGLAVFVRRQHDAHVRQRAAFLCTLHADLRARYRRIDRNAALVQALHAHGERHAAIALMHNRRMRRLARRSRHRQRRSICVTLRRIERLHDHLARGQQRRDRHAVPVAGHFKARTGAVGQLIDRARRGRAVFIHRRENHPRALGGEYDRLLRGGQRKHARLRLHAEPRCVAVRHAQHVFAAERIHRRHALRGLDLRDRLAVRVAKRQTERIANRLLHDLSLLVQALHGQAERLLFAREQLKTHLRHLTRAHL